MFFIYLFIYFFIYLFIYLIIYLFIYLIYLYLCVVFGTYQPPFCMKIFSVKPKCGLVK